MRAKEFEIKKRDPNWRAMQDIRRSGAGGQHKDKKKAAKQGDVKHKGKISEGPENLSIGQQMARDGITYSPEKEDELIGLMSQYMKKAGMSSKQIRYYLSYDEDFIPDQLSDLPKQGLSKGVAEDDEPDEEYLDKVISDLHKDALGFRPDQEFGREWMSSSFEEKLEIYNNMLRSLNMDEAQDDWGGMSHGEFKRKELQHELGHEDDPDFERKLRQKQMDKDRGPWYIKIDGKIYKQKGESKSFDWKKGANNYALAILKNRPELKGKIFITKNPADQ
jgi:hypothetical protein